MKHLTIIKISASPARTIGVSKILSEINPGFSVSSFTKPLKADEISRIAPSLIIAEPLLLSPETIDDVRASVRHRFQVVALQTHFLPPSLVRAFDNVISIYSPLEKYREIIDNLTTEEEEDNRVELSPREREVVIGIVKGLSNKEIADTINVSVNTVMTHRRNIAKKLQIHSPAALTVYAIVRRLVTLDELAPTAN